ncbi:lipoprotein N-acyltransferase Lnb domain-containing protein [Balneicella halophila]|nr:DUF4105 domain-containing protein [Balneicella halophila]
MSQKLSPEAEISILTCDPGEELYSLFGHSAIRVQDPISNMDLVFNYGTFDFSTPNFYMKFAQGRLDYLLSVSDYERFITSYKREKRSVYSQKLLLNPQQKQQLFEALLINYKPENRAYKYDFFMDNCATRIDEIIRNNIAGDWEFTQVPSKLGETYRTGIAPYLANSDWLNLGLNIVLGAPTDHLQKGLFLPDILKDNYTDATLNGKPIVANTRTLYDAQFVYSKTAFLLSPVFIFYLAAFLILLGSIFIPEKMHFADFILFFALGIAGSIIAFLWFAADHTATNDNWNIFWALPTHFIMAFVILFQHQKSKFTHYYFLVTLIIVCTLLIFMVFPQLFSIFNYAPLAFPFEMIIPILLCIIFRSLGIVRKKS